MKQRPACKGKCLSLHLEILCLPSLEGRPRVPDVIRPKREEKNLRVLRRKSQGEGLWLECWELGSPRIGPQPEEKHQCGDLGLQTGEAGYLVP